MNVPHTLRSAVFLAALAAFSTVVHAQAPAQGQARGGRGGGGPGLTLTTTAFEDGGIIPNRFTQADPNTVSPALSWSNVPEGTVSFALIMNDPDVTINRSTDDVLHWLIFNIPGTSRGLPENVPLEATLPDGSIQGLNRGGTPGYRGPGAPAAGPYHHYTFILYALDTRLDLTPAATRAEVIDAMNGHILGKGVLFGRFHR
jgi:Raf kinase inhibitor-like YbhB/YbcL family protein